MPKLSAEMTTTLLKVEKLHDFAEESALPAESLIPVVKETL